MQYFVEESDKYLSYSTSSGVKKHSALFPLAHGYQNQNGTQHRKCMVSSHDLCLLLIAQALVKKR